MRRFSTCHGEIFPAKSDFPDAEKFVRGCGSVPLSKALKICPSPPSVYCTILSFVFRIYRRFCWNGITGRSPERIILFGQGNARSSLSKRPIGVCKKILQPSNYGSIVSLFDCTHLMKSGSRYMILDPSLTNGRPNFLLQESSVPFVTPRDSTRN